MTAVDASTGEIVPLPVTGPPARTSPELLKAQVEEVRELMRAVLTEGVDYGQVGGVQRPTLFKSGAEMLLQWARLGHRLYPVEVERDDHGRKYGVTYRCEVFQLDRPDVVRASCDAYCGYDEPDREEHVNRRGKTVPRSPWNTVVKMAEKRALVGATLQATATSGLFTQDLDDLPSPTHVDSWWETNGWVDADEERRAHLALYDTLKASPADLQSAFRAWRTDAGIDLAKRLTRADYDRCVARVTELAAEPVTAEVVEDTPTSAPAEPTETCSVCGTVIDLGADGSDLVVFTEAGDPAHERCRGHVRDPF